MKSGPGAVMSAFLITCGEPVSGDFVRVDSRYFPVVEGAPGEWIVDIDGGAVPFDGTQSGLVTALCIGLLQAGYTISEDDSVISIDAISVIEQGSTFTVTEPEPVPDVVTSAFKQQMSADLDAVFLDEAEFAETVTLYPYSGRSGTGPVFGAAVDITVVVESRGRLVRDSKGQEFVTDLSGLCRASAGVKEDDHVVWEGRRYRVVRADPADGGIEFGCVSVAG